MILAWEDPELTDYEKQLVMLENIYKTRPANLEAAIRKAALFLNGGVETKEDDTPGPRVYSFSKDAGFIFAAFRQTHGIDLETAEMHWWKFLALLMDLGQDTTFCQLTALRIRVKSGKATKEERAMAQELGDVFEIPDVDTRTAEERNKEDEFIRSLAPSAT